MGFHVIPIFVYFNLMLVATHADLPPELYWKWMLPGTTMPKSITKLLNHGHMAKPVQDEQNAHIVKWGQHGPKETRAKVFYGAEHAPKETEFTPFYSYGAEHALKETEFTPFYSYGAEHAPKETEFTPFYSYGADHAPKETEFTPFYSYGAEHAPKETEFTPFYSYGAEHAPKETEFTPFYSYGADHAPKETEITAFFGYGADHAPKETEFTPFYSYGAEKSQYPLLNEDIFFKEEDIRPGKKLYLHINNKSQHAAPLLPRQITEPIPFSANKMKDILKKLSIKPKSENAVIVKKALVYCEAPAPPGEEKYCATSLESMLDFVILKLGKNVHALSTEVENNIKAQKIEMKGVTKLQEDNVVVCHRLDYPYVVFLCHKLTKTSTYFVPLEAEDGSRAKAIAVCHRDTSNWDPWHLAFRVLKVKPGTTSVCHFTYESTTVWLPK